MLCICLRNNFPVPVSICSEAITAQIWARRQFRANVENRLGPTKTVGFKKTSAPVPSVLIFTEFHFQGFWQIWRWFPLPGPIVLFSLLWPLRDHLSLHAGKIFNYLRKDQIIFTQNKTLGSCKFASYFTFQETISRTTSGCRPLSFPFLFQPSWLCTFSAKQFNNSACAETLSAPCSAMHHWAVPLSPLKPYMTSCL